MEWNEMWSGKKNIIEWIKISNQCWIYSSIITNMNTTRAVSYLWSPHGLQINTKLGKVEFQFYSLCIYINECMDYYLISIWSVFVNHSVLMSEKQNWDSVVQQQIFRNKIPFEHYLFYMQSRSLSLSLPFLDSLWKLILVDDIAI